MFKSVLLTLVALASLAMVQAVPAGHSSPSDHDSLHRKEPKPVPAGDSRPSDPPQADHYSGPQSASTVSALLDTFWTSTARGEKVSLLLNSNEGETTAMFKLGTTTLTGATTTTGARRRRSAATTTNITNCAHDNEYIISGNNIPGGQSVCTEGATGCALRCASAPECQAWTLKKDTNECWLKKSNHGTAPSDDWTWGPRCNHWENEFIISGNNIPGGQAIQTKGATDCAMRCTAEPDCQAWTLKKDNNLCWLKKSNHGTAPSDDWTWGPRCNHWDAHGICEDFAV